MIFFCTTCTNSSENFTHINSAPKITDLQHQGVNHMQGGNGLSPAEGAKSPSPTTITTAATAAPTTGHSNNLSQLPQQSKVILFTRVRDMDMVSKKLSTPHSPFKLHLWFLINIIKNKGVGINPIT